MVFNATFNNISVMSWQSVLLVEEIGVPGESTNLLQVTDEFLSVIRGRSLVFSRVLQFPLPIKLIVTV
jgi:hypothetical protein